MKKHFIGRVLTIMLIALLAINTAAFSESASPRLSLTGRVVAGETISLTAPYGGKVLDYGVEAGDVIMPGQSPFTIETTKLYAPCDGVVGGVRAQAGDETAYVEGRYGALMYIEPDCQFVIDTTTSDAYDKNENRIVHVGETVYLRSSNNNSRTGAGYVTKVEGKSFSVEVAEGNLNFDEKASIYRRDDYDSKSRIGSGKTARINPVAITGEGSVLRVHVEEGQSVKRGDVLAELVDGVLADYSASIIEWEITSEAIVKEVAVQPGQQVTKGSVLATLHPVERLEVAADLNEMDLGRVSVGDAVQVEFTGMGSGALVEGKVEAISSVSHTETGDAEYKVYVTLPASDGLREGMSATVYTK